MSFSGSEERWRSVVRIWNKGTLLSVGTGFIVDADHVMTCAHVVAEALGSSTLGNAAHPPDEEIQIDFPVLSDSAFHLAKPVGQGWRPRLPDDITRLKGTSAADDVAVLKFVNPEKLPSDRRPIIACAQFKPGDPIAAYGIKAGLPQGTWVSAEIKDYVTPARVEVFAPYLELAVQHGCSGGAVWNTVRPGVAGMVVEMETGRQGRIIPIEKLREVWPEIRVLADADHSVTELHAGVPVGQQLLDILYTFDRERQEGDFDEAMDRLWGVSRRPVISIIAGIQDDLPDLCRERCVRIKLHERLEGIEIGSKPPSKRNVPWPQQRNLRTASNLEMLKQQVKTVLRARDTSPNEIRQVYNAGVVPWVFVSLIKRSIFDQSHYQLLMEWLGFWREVGSQPLNKPLAVFLLFDLSGQSPADFCLEKFFKEELQNRPPDGIRALQLLNDFDVREVADWVNEKAPELGVPDEDRLRVRQAITQSLGRASATLRLGLLEQCLDQLTI